MVEDPFPRERVAATLRRMPAYLKLAWRLGRDPLLSRARRAAIVAAAGYLASPIDLVPGVIPVLGQLDDIAVVLATLRFALAGLDAERRHMHLEAVGLGDDDLEEDLRTVAATSAWLVRAGARTTGRAVARGGKAAVAWREGGRQCVDQPCLGNPAGGVEGDAGGEGCGRAGSGSRERARVASREPCPRGRAARRRRGRCPRRGGAADGVGPNIGCLLEGNATLPGPPGAPRPCTRHRTACARHCSATRRSAPANARRSGPGPDGRPTGTIGVDPASKIRLSAASSASCRRSWMMSWRGEHRVDLPHAWSSLRQCPNEWL